LGKFTIYFPNEKEQVVKRFKRLFRARSVESASKKLLWFMEQEVIKNDPNWQKRLTAYTANEPAQADPYGCGSFIAQSGGLIRCKQSEGLQHEGYCLHVCMYGPSRRKPKRRARK